MQGWGATCRKCWAFSYGRGCSALSAKLLPSPWEAGSTGDLLVLRGQRDGPWDVGAPPVSSVVGPEVQLLGEVMVGDGKYSPELWAPWLRR